MKMGLFRPPIRDQANFPLRPCFSVFSLAKPSTVRPAEDHIRMAFEQYFQSSKAFLTNQEQRLELLRQRAETNNFEAIMAFFS